MFCLVKMVISISVIGLSLVVVAWVLEFFLMGEEKKLNVWFVVFYSLGVAVLVYDGFAAGLNDLAAVNLVSLVVALGVLVRMKFF